MPDAGVIILAAGASSRLGRPKQTLYYNGKTLLQHTADEALRSNLHPVVIVTGANESQVLANMDLNNLVVVHNDEWEEGMGTGISRGIEEILRHHPPDAIIIAVCDQPFVSATVFQELIEKHEQTEKGIVASAYANTLGTPALFSDKYLTELQELKGDEGAKKFFSIYAEDVATIDFDAGSIDIDTQEDYNVLIDNSSDHATE